MLKDKVLKGHAKLVTAIFAEVLCHIEDTNHEWGQHRPSRMTVDDLKYELIYNIIYNLTKPRPSMRPVAVPAAKPFAKN